MKMDIQIIQNKIYEIRGQRVMLDFDLAELYQVPTKVLKQAVRRNSERFPSDFMFEITESEYNVLKISLRSQSVTSNKGGIRYMPFAFTEQGVSMLSAVLRSSVAIQTSITIMRSFVSMRNYILQSTQVSAELLELRSRLQLVEHDCRENLEAPKSALPFCIPPAVFFIITGGAGKSQKNHRARAAFIVP